MKQTSRKSASGFSFIEVSIAVSIVIILSTLLYPVFKTAIRRADQNNGLNQLRNFGQAMMLYVGEHDGTLPGPLWPGQVMEYDPAIEGRLVRELAPYLGYPESNEIYLVKSFPPKMLLNRTAVSNLSRVRPYVLNLDVTNAEGELVRPFGNLAATNSTNTNSPLKYIQLPPEIRSKWMMSDADQEHPRVLGTTWRPFTPPKPIYGNTRNALFYDLHVESMPLTAFQ